MNYTLIKEWINYKSLSCSELMQIQKPLDGEKLEYTDTLALDYCKLSIELINLIPNFSIDSASFISWRLRLAPTATNLIDKLFETEVDDDTLVITSEREHPSVINARNKCKNVFVANYIDNFVNCKTLNLPTTHKKVFLYIISTQVGTGEITPNYAIENIINFYKSNGIKIKVCLDDCQGMFCVQRDYSIFDYVLFTAHSLFKGTNQGMLFSKYTNKHIGNYSTEALLDILTKFKLINDKKDKILSFKNVMTQTFFEFIKRNNFELVNDYNNFGGIFSFKVPKEYATKENFDWLTQSYVYLDYSEEDNAKDAFVRFRAQQFITHPDKLIEGIEKVITLVEGGF